MLVVLRSTSDGIHNFRRLSRKLKKKKKKKKKKIKNEVFDDCGTAENKPFLLVSKFCIFLIQMSKYLHFSCPEVNWCWFLSFKKAFQKVTKN